MVDESTIIVPAKAVKIGGTGGVRWTRVYHSGILWGWLTNPGVSINGGTPFQETSIWEPQIIGNLIEIAN